MPDSIYNIEKKLDSFNYDERTDALSKLCEMARRSEITLPAPTTATNMHCHSFFSYNSYGYSPSKFAWLAGKAGLAVAGVIDFDVLDGADEFLQAGQAVDLKTSAGLETRVFVPEFSDKIINSPGQPGIAYHIGVGFNPKKLTGWVKNFLTDLKKTAQHRNRELTQRVNKYLSPVELDFEKDVLILTPSDNPTERHICLAYARKAAEIFGDKTRMAKFWTEKLAIDIKSSDLPESRELLNTIRTKTIKRGGPGYVRPDAGAFPTIRKTNEFFLAAGAIPTLAWLDGTSQAESNPEKLLQVAVENGAAAVNIIPDRNYTPGVKDEKLANLYNFVDAAEKMRLPIIVGTEMNSPGQKFVDSFDTPELSPLVPVFLKGAYIVYAHSVLENASGLGYTSQWAGKNFPSAAEKNQFYHELGRTIQPRYENKLTGLDENITPEQILRKIR